MFTPLGYRYRYLGTRAKRGENKGKKEQEKEGKARDWQVEKRWEKHGDVGGWFGSTWYVVCGMWDVGCGIGIGMVHTVPLYTCLPTK